MSFAALAGAWAWLRSNWRMAATVGTVVLLASGAGAYSCHRARVAAEEAEKARLREEAAKALGAAKAYETVAGSLDLVSAPLVDAGLAAEQRAKAAKGAAEAEKAPKPPTVRTLHEAVDDIDADLRSPR